MEMISVGSSSCSYTSPTWTPGIITIILILQETEALGGHKPSSKLHSGGVGTPTMSSSSISAMSTRIFCDDGSILYLQYSHY